LVGCVVCAIVSTEMVIIPSNTNAKAWLIRILLNIETSSGISEAFYFGRANLGRNFLTNPIAEYSVAKPDKLH
jgi:hypothetical protein